MRRHLTAAQRDRYDDQEQEAYEDACEQIESKLIQANKLEGGDENYRPSGALVHRLAMREIEQVKAWREE